MIPFENSFQTLPRFFFEPVEVLPLTGARLLHASPLKTGLGLGGLSGGELKSWLNGEIRIPGDQRIATRYAGHQFGVWAAAVAGWGSEVAG